MNMEILAAKGQLAGHKKRYRDLDMEAAGLRIIVRQVLSPYEDDVTQLRVDEAAASMNRLKTVVAEMRELKAKIARIEADLG
jgi:hypothetical protein